MKEFERVLDAQWGLLSERMQASKRGSGLKMSEDPFEAYLAVDRKEIDY